MYHRNSIYKFICFTIVGLGFSPFIFKHNYDMNHSVWMSLGIITMITLPFVIVGIPFSFQLSSQTFNNGYDSISITKTKNFINSAYRFDHASLNEIKNKTR